MRGMVKERYIKFLIVYLVFSLAFILGVPARSFAYVLSSIEVNRAFEGVDRGRDINVIVKELESKMITERLKSLGLSAGEIKKRLNKLSDEDIHKIARRIDSLKAGGSVTGFIIGLLMIVILILVILRLTDRRIIIK